MLASLLRITGALFLLYLLSQLIIWAVSPGAEAQAQQLVEQVQRQGPKDITPEMRLMRAAFENRQLRLEFSMDAARARKLDPALMQQVYRNAMCADAQTRSINRRLSVLYVIEADGEALHRFELPVGSCT